MGKERSSSDEQAPITLRRVCIRDTYVWERGDYIFWPDARTRGWRWAKKEWEDDGVGIQHHGAAHTLEAAVYAAQQHAADYPDFRA
jgi:hypothetical protein